VKQMLHSVTNLSSSKLSEKLYSVGDEWVKIKTQFYEKCALSFLLQVSIFGQCYNKLMHHELVCQKMKSAVIHIASVKEW